MRSVVAGPIAVVCGDDGRCSSLVGPLASGSGCGEATEAFGGDAALVAAATGSDGTEDGTEAEPDDAVIGAASAAPLGAGGLASGGELPRVIAKRKRSPTTRHAAATIRIGCTPLRDRARSPGFVVIEEESRSLGATSGIFRVGFSGDCAVGSGFLGPSPLSVLWSVIACFHKGDRASGGNVLSPPPRAARKGARRTKTIPYPRHVSVTEG